MAIPGQSYLNRDRVKGTVKAANLPEQNLVGVRNMADTITKSGVRDAAGGMNVGTEVYDELDTRVREMIDRAADRAQENGRKTLKARDV
jgi:histone H3/H4